jgi:hypothetical protein
MSPKFLRRSAVKNKNINDWKKFHDLSMEVLKRLYQQNMLFKLGDVPQITCFKEVKVLHESLKAYLVNRKRTYMLERLDILTRYGAISTEELENKIKIGGLPEHPAWEDLIDLKNIEAELQAIENDIKRL